MKLVIGNKNNVFIIKVFKLSDLYEKYTPIKDVIGNNKNVTCPKKFGESGDVSATFFIYKETIVKITHITIVINGILFFVFILFFQNNCGCDSTIGSFCKYY